MHTLLALGLAAAVVAVTKVPLQHFYTAETASAKYVDRGGCNVTAWTGTDSNGVLGYPSVTKIQCPPAATFAASGVQLAGHLRVFLWYGTANVNGALLNMTGSALWVAAGATISVAIAPGGSGLDDDGTAIYVLGAPFDLMSRAPARMTSSFGAPAFRAYIVQDALSGVRGANNVHDPHIGNGTTNARDLIFSAGATSVDPPNIAVLNCAPSANESYVWFHSHAQGAVYLPFSGRLCFATDENRCCEPGFPRWVSPSLYYYETFTNLPTTRRGSASAKRLITAAGMTNCPSPITFGVTNFDPDHSVGQPNFKDLPAKTRPCGSHAGCPFPARWGYFDALAVRTTTFFSTVVEVDVPTPDVEL